MFKNYIKKKYWPPYFHYNTSNSKYAQDINKLTEEGC